MSRFLQTQITKAEWQSLRPGDKLVDRQGHVWVVTSEPKEMLLGIQVFFHSPDYGTNFMIWHDGGINRMLPTILCEDDEDVCVDPDLNHPKVRIIRA